MRKRIVTLIIMDLAFLLMLSLSGIGGTLGNIIYFASFIVPIFMGLAIIAKERALKPSSCDSRRILPSIALFAPTLLVIIGISTLTSYLLTLFGKSNVTDVSGDLFANLLRHALLPALLEEMLFRFIPVRLIGARSQRAAMLVSSILFSLIHMNLFQIPYALFAGSVFAFLTLVTGSIIPSMILHFINNTVSVIWMRSPELTLPIIIVIAVIAVISLVYIFIRRREYSAWVREAASGEPIGRCPELVIFAVILLAAAILNLR